ncbi:hypothetical protein P5V15_008225 [Pogonomyrmex californicus]
MAFKTKLLYNSKNNILSGETETVHLHNVGNMILHAFKSEPDFIGQVDAKTGEKITFQQMRENSVKCALWLQNEGIGYQDKITICTCNQMDAYVPFLASLFIGSIVNPWDARYFQDFVRVMYFLSEFDPDVIFIDDNNYEKLQQALDCLNMNDKICSPKIITFGKIDNVISLESILNIDIDKSKIMKFSCKVRNTIDVVGTMFSSSATSYPGTSSLRYFAFTFPSNQCIPVMSFGDVGLWYEPLCWTYSLLLIVRSIISFVTVIKSSEFSEENLYKTIEKYKVTWVFLTNKAGDQLLRVDSLAKYDLSSLKEFIFDTTVTHNDIDENFIKQLSHVSFVRVYSVSTTHIIINYYRRNYKTGYRSYLAKNIQLMILDIKTQGAVNPKKLGEIWYKLECLWCTHKTCEIPSCENYRAKRSIDMKYCAPITSTWHCTGNYGFYETANNLLFVVDKIKNIIKYKTYLISAAQIECVLLKHPAVSEVVVRGVSHPTDIQHPVAYIKKKIGIKVTEEELNQYVIKDLPISYKLHGGIFFRNKMPYLPNGNIDRMLVQLDL